MTQYAKLPDGNVLEFPDEMPEAEITAKVKQALGVPLPEEIARVEDVNLAAQRNQGIAALAAQVARLNAGITRLCEDQYRTHEPLANLILVVGGLNQTVAEAARVLGDGLRAPERMTVERDEQGRILRTRIEKDVG